jgi:intracellular sulfur oxidation DsrE/DsrF family protein
MKERKVEKEALLTEAGTVPFALVEIISRQEKGWSYIKLGN